MKKILFFISMTVAPAISADAQSVDIKKIKEINFKDVALEIVWYI